MSYMDESTSSYWGYTGGGETNLSEIDLSLLNSTIADELAMAAEQYNNESGSNSEIANGYAMRLDSKKWSNKKRLFLLVSLAAVLIGGFFGGKALFGKKGSKVTGGKGGSGDVDDDKGKGPKGSGGGLGGGFGFGGGGGQLDGNGGKGPKPSGGGSDGGLGSKEDVGSQDNSNTGSSSNTGSGKSSVSTASLKPGNVENGDPPKTDEEGNKDKPNSKDGKHENQQQSGQTDTTEETTSGTGVVKTPGAPNADGDKPEDAGNTGEQDKSKQTDGNQDPPASVDQTSTTGAAAAGGTGGGPPPPPGGKKGPDGKPITDEDEEDKKQEKKEDEETSKRAETGLPDPNAPVGSEAWLENLPPIPSAYPDNMNLLFQEYKTMKAAVDEARKLSSSDGEPSVRHAPAIKVLEAVLPRCKEWEEAMRAWARNPETKQSVPQQAEALEVVAKSLRVYIGRSRNILLYSNPKETPDGFSKKSSEVLFKEGLTGLGDLAPEMAKDIFDSK